MLLVVCGVSGTGKSTIGALCAERLSIPFYDADDFHPQSNIAKMASGIPLTDEDRQPWLETLSQKLPAWSEGGAVLACSAIKESYRAMLGSRMGKDLEWIVLTAPEEVLKARLSSRAGHFFDPRLLSHQLKEFEAPDYGLTLDARQPPTEILSTILERI